MKQSTSILRRALLYVPGSSQKMLEKSRSFNVDLAVYDLEDSVAPHLKLEARSAVTQFLNKPKPSNIKEQGVRINAVDTGLALQDLTTVLKASSLDTIVVPKVNSAADLHFVTDVIRHLLPYQNHQGADKRTAPIKILALIESAKAIMSLPEICASSPYLDGLAFAAEDFATDLGITRTPSLSEFLYARSAIVTASKAYALTSAMDLVHTDFRGENAKSDLAKETQEGRTMGFNGKQCIHPSQVEVVQSIYGPNQEEVEWAVRVVVADRIARDVGRGAWTLNGKMIDIPIVERSMRLIERAKLCGYDMETLFAAWKDQKPE